MHVQKQKGGYDFVVLLLAWTVRSPTKRPKGSAGAGSPLRIATVRSPVQ